MGERRYRQEPGARLMPIWGFIFVLAAAIVFAVAGLLIKSLPMVGFLSVGLIFTFATTSSPVHF